MKYRARPVIVDAWKIERVIKPEPSNAAIQATSIKLEDGRLITVSQQMLARFEPQKGDYYVVQEDGYAYLNPREVFERKYEPAETGEG